MKHALKVTVILFAVFVLVAGGLCAFALGAFEWSPKAVYYRFFYPKDRITAHLLVTVDGKNQPVEQSAIRCFYDMEGTAAEPLCVQAEGKALRISTPAAAYGIYRLHVPVPPYSFELELTHFNWWDVCAYDICLAIDTVRGTATVSGSYTHLDEEAKPVREALHGTQTLSQETRFYLGG